MNTTIMMNEERVWLVFELRDGRETVLYPYKDPYKAEERMERLNRLAKQSKSPAVYYMVGLEFSDDSAFHQEIKGVDDVPSSK